MVLLAAEICEDRKGTDTRILELDPADAGLTDFFLITSGNNTRQTGAIADEIELRMKRDFGTYAKSVEGRRTGEWILLDYVDFVVHIFTEEKREFYDIERLRKSARSLDTAELSAALRAKTEEARKKGSAKKALPSDTSGSDTELAEIEAAPAPKKAAKKAAKKAVAKAPAKQPPAPRAAKKAPAKTPGKKAPAKAAAKISPAKAAAKKAPAKAAAKKAPAKAPAKKAAKKAPAKKAAAKGSAPDVTDTSRKALGAGATGTRKQLPSATR